MSLTRILAIFMRYFYPLRRLDTMADLIFWPIIDILLWGITSSWLQQGHTTIGNIALMMMCGLLFWQIVWRTEYDVAVNMLNELWARNLSNLFISPLKFSEWIAGVMLLGLAKAVFALSLSALIIFGLYSVNVFVLNFSILPFFFFFSIIGWTLGFFSAGIIIYFGQRLQQLAWMVPWIIAPFSAIFYPVTALPEWAQGVAAKLPTTQLFEHMRSVISGEPFSWSTIALPASIASMALVAAMLFFGLMFRKRKHKGLMGLE